MTQKINSRLGSIDLIRGYFLIVIMIDHLGRFPNGLEFVTGRGAMWVSAAEGFFFVSGLMVGLTRVGKISQIGFSAVLKKLWQRAGLLYLLNLGLTLGFTAISFALGWAPKSGLTELRDWPSIVWQAATLHYAYGWSDFLPRYAIYMALSPLAAYLIYRRMWWAVSWASILIWVFGGTFDRAWQILFFGGMVAGFYLPYWRAAIAGWSERARELAFRATVGAGAVAIVTTFIFCAVPLYFVDYAAYIKPLFQAIGQPGWFITIPSFLHGVNDAVGTPVFGHDDMAYGRVLLFILTFAGLFLAVQRYETCITKWTGWLLKPLGQHSLSTYVTHAIVIYAVDTMLTSNDRLRVNLLVTLTTILVVWLVVEHILPRLKLAGIQLRQYLSQTLTSPSFFSNPANLVVGHSNLILISVLALVAVVTTLAIRAVKSVLTHGT